MSMSRSYEEKMDEALDRLRRLETRFTKFMEKEGYDTGVARASWLRRGAVTIPTPATSIKEILSVIPAGHRLQVEVTLKGVPIALITPAERLEPDDITNGG